MIKEITNECGAEEDGTARCFLFKDETRNNEALASLVTQGLSTKNNVDKWLSYRSLTLNDLEKVSADAEKLRKQFILDTEERNCKEKF